MLLFEESVEKKLNNNGLLSILKLQFLFWSQSQMVCFVTRLKIEKLCDH